MCPYPCDYYYHSTPRCRKRIALGLFFTKKFLPSPSNPLPSSHSRAFRVLRTLQIAKGQHRMRELQRSCTLEKMFVLSNQTKTIKLTTHPDRERLRKRCDQLPSHQQEQEYNQYHIKHRHNRFLCLSHFLFITLCR